MSWAFRGGLDLRDEVAGTEGTIWTDHHLRTGFEVYATGAGGGYHAEKPSRRPAGSSRWATT